MRKPVRYHGLVHTIKDKRQRERYLRQLKKRGFDNTELWNLYETFISFMLPRLKEYIKMETKIHAESDFHYKVKKFCRALEICSIIEDPSHMLSLKYYTDFFDENSEVYKEYKEGMDYFGEIFRGLWL
jgi:hypothetical protein